jgi:hypothetical protein
MVIIETPSVRGTRATANLLKSLKVLITPCPVNSFDGMRIIHSAKEAPGFYSSFLLSGYVKNFGFNFQRYFRLQIRKNHDLAAV